LNEKILLVEDCPELRGIVTEMLEGSGYQVAAVASGDEALKLLRTNKHQMDMIVTDLTMPNMTGYELIQAALELNPALHFLYVSGYTNQNVADAFNFLEKPFKKVDLLNKVRTILDANLLRKAQ
jgi:CheY-like chemotaxis protein